MSTGPTGAACVAASSGATGPTGTDATGVGNVIGAVTADVTAPVIPPDAKISDVTYPETKEAAFLRCVVPWPAPGGPGYINLHYKNPRHLGMAGKPFTTLHDTLSYISWAQGHPSYVSDLYFCLSQQAENGGPSNGKLRAARSAENATSLKAIWIDLDGNKSDPGKGYPTKDAALDAFAKFITASQLPPPSAIVNSGGGFHIYWISDQPLTLDEWRPYANGLWALKQKHGLVADPVTTDAARILRVPGTFNYKTQPPRPVKLRRLGQVYDFAVTFKGMAQAAPATPLPPGDKPRASSVMINPALFPPKAPVTNDVLAEDCQRKKLPPLDAWSVISGCPHYKDAVQTGGVAHNQGLWMQTILGATWFKGGRKIAHALGQKHAGYIAESTDAMFDRKVVDREQRGLGWPSCKTFENNGSKLCATCKHFSLGKSPLHLGLQSVPAADPTQANYRSGNGQSPNWTDPLDFHQVSEDEAIARVNAAGYFVLTPNGDIYKIEPHGGVIIQKREGFNNLFACRQARGNDGKLTSAGSAWRDSSKRNEYASIGYWPGDHCRPAKSYNLWRGWGIEPKQGNWSIICDHILNVIADGNKDKANFILDWCAHMVQQPWDKPGVALVLRGRKGTGKTLLTEILARAIGGPNTLITANGKKLFAQFNWHLADKLLIGAEEAFFAGNHEQNDQLKHLLTGDKIEVEQKFGQRISMKSMHRVIMTSNHDQVVAASDDERRFFVCDVSDKRRGDDVYFAPLVRVIKGDDDATLAAFMYELQTRNIKNWKPEHAARKAASTDLARQKLLSLEPPLQWLLEVETAAPAVPAQQTVQDVGKPDGADAEMDQRVQNLTAGPANHDKQDTAVPAFPAQQSGQDVAKPDGADVDLDQVQSLMAKPADPEKQDTSPRERQREDMLEGYRYWAKSAQVRGATDFTSAPVFWRSIKRLLNDEIFPGRRLFRSSGGKRSVFLPPKSGVTGRVQSTAGRQGGRR